MAILDQFDLSGKTAIITGAGSNLGREMALAMADAGADIVGAGRRPEPLDETGEMIRAKGRRYLARSTDVTDSSDVGALMAEAIAEFGRIDVLVNNAGGGSAGRGKTLPEHTDEDWYSGIDANLSSAFFCEVAFAITRMSTPAESRAAARNSIGQLRTEYPSFRNNSANGQ